MRTGILLKRGKNTVLQFLKKSTELGRPLDDWLASEGSYYTASHGATPHTNALKK